MNKRGFIKTLEAVLAIMIVFIFIFSLGQTDNSENSQREAMSNIQEGILQGISQNEAFRNCIINTEDTKLNLIGVGNLCPEIKQYIENTLPNRFKDRYKIQVCDDSSYTWDLPDEKYLYTSAVVISTDLESYNPRIFRIWMW